MYGSFFAFIGNCVAFPIKAKSAPRGSHCGEKEFVASRPAAGRESCSAGFYFNAIGNCAAFPMTQKSAPRGSALRRNRICRFTTRRRRRILLGRILFSRHGKLRCISYDTKKRSAWIALRRKGICRFATRRRRRILLGRILFLCYNKRKYRDCEKTYTVTKEREWKKPLMRSFFTHPVCDARHKHGVYGRQKIVCTIFCRSVAQSAPERGRHEVL